MIAVVKLLGDLEVLTADKLPAGPAASSSLRSSRSAFSSPARLRVW
jgi:hypothetical protein